MEELDDKPLFQRVLQDGREITIWPMSFGNVRLCIAAKAGVMYYDDGWCYANRHFALVAAMVWDGEGDPLDGWHRQISTGRRRINGDPSKEMQQW